MQLARQGVGACSWRGGTRGGGGSSEAGLCVGRRSVMVVVETRAGRRTEPSDGATGALPRNSSRVCAGHCAAADARSAPLAPAGTGPTYAGPARNGPERRLGAGGDGRAVPQAPTALHD